MIKVFVFEVSQLFSSPRAEFRVGSRFRFGVHWDDGSRLVSSFKMKVGVRC